MSKRRVVRRSNTKKLTEEEKAKVIQQQEERGKEALERAKASIKSTSAQTEQNQITNPQQIVEKPNLAQQTPEIEKSIQTVTRDEFPQKHEQETTKKAKLDQDTNTKPTLRKKEKFEDKHKRVTTYILNEYHQKLNEVRKNYDIPISETINNALTEYFKKYNL